MKNHGIKNLNHLHFERETGQEAPLFTDGKLNLYGYNRITSAITQLIANCKSFDVELYQTGFYYSAFGAELINRLSDSKQKAKASGGQFEYCIDLNGEHIGHWKWKYESDPGYFEREEYNKARHIVTTFGNQVIDFHTPVFLDYLATDRSYWDNGLLVNGSIFPVITPMMYDRNIIRRFKDWAIPRDGLTVYAAWKPGHHKEYWLIPEVTDDVQAYTGGLMELFKERFVCRELEQFNGLDTLDYTKPESYIWPKGRK